ncbi:Predicted polyphosphate- or ATP-dependent NAD kinase [Haloechinothrix alba]|uniref:Predicted polyphosphate- or ATP-dependent NAD kinase n=1 Tax=Haloechinothrix alba TaxID=664784 RepID=A0A238Y0T5_9PSEU|nr:NAD(+)/NADH kinase [Haloechinothrix alba]SNR64916.1 Predicted polyphosphate- or ATP-dependent NAD kinase [Haloechinothrix alba]
MPDRDADVAVGIVANPASGRDIRRLVAQASVFPTTEKADMVQRILAGLAATGVDSALLSVDLGGISAGVLRARNRRRPGADPPWPHVTFLDEDVPTNSAQDTRNAVGRMLDAGARVVICLGGDGTARVAASAILDHPAPTGARRDVPLMALSTGTNNVFPRLREATVAGVAAGLVATGAVDPATATTRARILDVDAGDRRERALVDVGVCAAHFVGSRALWDPTAVSEIYCAFAEPDAVGLSSIAGLICPSPREKPQGVVLRLGSVDSAPVVVRAPIAPGVVLPVGVLDWCVLRSGEARPVTATSGVIAVDGEREIELHGDRAASVRLRDDGSLCVDIAAVMSEAAGEGLLRSHH